MKNTKQKKEEIQAEFQKNQQILNQLVARQEQLKGKFELLEQMEKEEKPSKKGLDTH